MTSVQDNPPTIMIVEDDERLADLTCEYLQSNGLDVSVVSDGEEAIRRIRSEQPDLVVLDLMLPGADGLTVCREVRATFKNPILMLTARTDDMDQVLGLEMGADDYVAKPVKPRVLLARIRAILRRSGSDHPLILSEQFDEKPGEVLERGRLYMDPARHHVTWEGEPVSLTVTEFLLLEALATRPGVIKSRNQLMDAAYPDDVFVDDRTVDSHIKRMRRKFRAVDKTFSAIETLYGAGYSFNEG